MRRLGFFSFSIVFDEPSRISASPLFCWNMLTSIIRRGSIHPENNGRAPSFQDSPKAGGTKEYCDRAFGKLVGEREKSINTSVDHHDNPDVFNLPTVLEACNCSFYPNDMEHEGDSVQSTRIEGWLFCTQKAMYFVSFIGTNIILDWVDAVECYTTVPNAITIHYRSQVGITQSHIFGKLQRREKVLRLMNTLILEASNNATSNSPHHEQRKRFQTDGGQLFDKPPSINLIPLKEQQKRRSTSSLSQELTNTSPPKSPSRSRTKSEPEALFDHLQLSKLDRELGNGSMGLDLSESGEATVSPPDYERVVLRRARSHTMPDLTVHRSEGEYEPSFQPDRLSEIQPLQKSKRQESASTTSSQKHRAVKYKGKKKGKREEAHPQAETNPENKEQKMNPQRVSGIHRNVFVHHFGQAGQSSPRIVVTYSCAYHPKNEDNILPLLHGRMFCTFENMYFVGWQNKKIILSWDDIISLQRESTAWNTIPNAIRIFYNTNGDTSSYFFGSFINREASLSAIENLLNFHRSEKRAEGGRQNLSRRRSITLSPEHSSSNQSFPIGKDVVVPHDERISTMTSMAHKRFRNVSIHEFFNTCWRDQNDSFYGHFLIHKLQNHDVIVGPWETMNNCGDDAGFYHAWSEEYYTMKRSVSYKFTRKTHLYIGPPIAEVNETQYCRFDGNQLVVAITVDINGVPFSENFSLEIRWVVRCDGDNGLIVDVGQLTNFKKRIMLASKIRDSTTEEMRPITMSHVEFCRQSCEKVKGDINETSDNSSVASSKELIVDSSNISPFNLNFRSGLRSFLYPWFSILEIAQNVVGRIQMTHLFLIVLSLYFLLKGSYFGREESTITTIHKSCSLELVELSYQIKALTEETKLIRRALLTK